jgi:mRNA-degrading endonuclease RelE of RelBE toxin-antitoxin system
METTWARSASKEAEAIPKAKREAVMKAIAAYAADPFGPHPNAKPMKGEKNAVRLRVGDYRVVMVRLDNCLEIIAVAHRKEVYR